MGLSVGLWRITADGPQRMVQARVEVEEQLEEWIEREPALVQSNLTVVGRQVATAAGWIDLLAIDPLGRWIVIEIKRGAVRRETVAQALDYAACIAALPLTELAAKIDSYLAGRARQEGTPRTLAEVLNTGPGASDDDVAGREVAIVVVGTSRDPGLDRMVDFLANRGNLPITVVTFGVFHLADGQRVLARELTEADERLPLRTALSVDDVLAQADTEGVGADFRAVYRGLSDLGLSFQVRRRSVMFTPPNTRSRCLITIDNRPTARGTLNVYVAADTIEQFLGIPAATVEERLGGKGWLELPPPRPQQFADAAVALLGPVLRPEHE